MGVKKLRQNCWCAEHGHPIFMRQDLWVCPADFINKGGVYESWLINQQAVIYMCKFEFDLIHSEIRFKFHLHAEKSNFRRAQKV